MGVALVAATPASAETLRQAIAAAWDGNPELAAARARQDALAETPNQARAAGRLTAAATGNAGYDRLGSNATGVRTGSTSALGGVTATLPIWTGGRVSSAILAAQGDVAAGGETLRDVEADVLERVVAAYADLLYTQQAVEVARVGIQRLDSQVAEARSRYGLGQATRTDVAQLEAQRASVVSNLVDAEGAVASAAAAYRAIVGRDAGTLEAVIATPAALAANPGRCARRGGGEQPAAPRPEAARRGGDGADRPGACGRCARRRSGWWLWAWRAMGGRFRHRLRQCGQCGPVASCPAADRRTRCVAGAPGGANARAERFDADAAARGAVRAADTAGPRSPLPRDG